MGWCCHLRHHHVREAIIQAMVRLIVLISFTIHFHHRKKTHHNSSGDSSVSLEQHALPSDTLRSLPYLSRAWKACLYSRNFSFRLNLFGPKVQQLCLASPFSVKCMSHSEGTYKGREVNARKETTDEKYYATTIDRFYICCTRCDAENLMSGQ